MPHITLLCIGIKDTAIVFLVLWFFEQMTIFLYQNSNFINHATICEIFHQNISHAEHFSKYSKPIAR